MAKDITTTEGPTNPARRDAITAAIAAVIGGAALTMASGPAEAFENSKGDRCLTVLFPTGEEGAKFDIDYYVNHHIPFVLSLYGPSIRNYEVFQAQPGPGGKMPPFFAMANIWIADPKAFAEAGRQHGKDFQPDVPNFTNVKTIGFTNVLYKVIPGKK